MTDPGRIPFTVRLAAESHRRLRQAALDQRTTAADIARRAIDDFLNREEENG